MVVNFWPALGPISGIDGAAGRPQAEDVGPRVALPRLARGRLKEYILAFFLPKEEDVISQRHGPEARRI